MFIVMASTSTTIDDSAKLPDPIADKPKHPQQKQPKKKKGSSGVLVVTDTHKRMNYLHQAAVFLSSTGTSQNDAFSKISRRYSRGLREVMNTDVMKVEPDIARTFCKKCKEVFVATGVRKFKLQMKNNTMTRECLSCGFTNNYQINKKYKSRNEKHRLTVVK